MPASNWLKATGILVLLLSLLMLFVGPALFVWFSGSHHVAQTLDRVIVVVLVLMVVVLVIWPDLATWLPETARQGPG